jgi:hypothetical protein
MLCSGFRSDYQVLTLQIHADLTSFADAVINVAIKRLVFAGEDERALLGIIPTWAKRRGIP